MPLFGFADIRFDKGNPAQRGPLSSLAGSQFQQTTLRYPIDIGNADKSHYMVIYIREQKQTSFKGQAANESSMGTTGGITPVGVNPVGQIQTGINGLASELGNKINSGLSQLGAATGGAFGSQITQAGNVLNNALAKAQGTLNNLFGKSLNFSGSSAQTQAVFDTSVKKITNNSFLQKTTLTTDAIALYMPDTLNYTYTQSYDQLNLGGEIGGQMMAAGRSISDAFKGEEGLKAVSEAGGSLAKSAGLFGAQKLAQLAGNVVGQGSAQVGFTAITGVVQNPLLEMIYKSPNFRNFQFEFTFYPRDEKEAYEVQKIIERLRFHQAPEFAEGAKGFLIPPSEFDIRFYYAGKQNPNIPPIATCILESIDVNYAPNGFSAYEIPGENQPSLGRTGMPVAIQLTLQFRETTYLTKQDFDSTNATRSASAAKAVVDNINRNAGNGLGGI